MFLTYTNFHKTVNFHVQFFDKKYVGHKTFFFPKNYLEFYDFLLKNKTLLKNTHLPEKYLLKETTTLIFFTLNANISTSVTYS